MTKKTIDPGKTYQTRHGWDVRNVQHRVFPNTDYLITADVYDPAVKRWVDTTYSSFGEYWAGETGDRDLIEVVRSDTITKPILRYVHKDGTYRTRDGRQVRILCTDAVGQYPVAALVRNQVFLTCPETDNVFMYSADGQKVSYCGDLDDEYYADLALVEVSEAVAA